MFLGSEINADGKVISHRDYFDFIGPTFGPVPVLGRVREMALQEICGLIRSLETHAQTAPCLGSIQRVEEFWGERLWLSFQNVRLVTAAPNPRKTVINASLDMLRVCYKTHHGAWACMGASE